MWTYLGAVPRAVLGIGLLVVQHKAELVQLAEEEVVEAGGRGQVRVPAPTHTGYGSGVSP